MKHKINTQNVKINKRRIQTVDNAALGKTNVFDTIKHSDHYSTPRQDMLLIKTTLCESKGKNPTLNSH